MRKGFTLIELLIGSTVSIVVVGTILFFFSYIYQLILDHVSSMEGNVSTFWVAEIINSDLRKAGYNVNAIENLPVECNSNLLTIRYVDYKKGCKNRTFEKNDDCSYSICYYLKDNNLERAVDKGDNETDSRAPMFDEKIITVENFTVDITDHTVQYKIEGRIKSKFKDGDKEFSIGDTIICRNWK